MNKQDNDVKLMYSCLLPRGKEKIVRVTFERGDSYAEGIVPDGTIEKQKGFTEEEVTLLGLYLKQNEKDIFRKAKDITGIQHWF